MRSAVIFKVVLNRPPVFVNSSNSLSFFNQPVGYTAWPFFDNQLTLVVTETKKGVSDETPFGDVFVCEMILY